MEKDHYLKSLITLKNENRELGYYLLEIENTCQNSCLNLSDLKYFDSKFSGLFLCSNTNLYFLDKQEYGCVSMFKRLNIINGTTINKKRLLYLHSIFHFKFFKMDDISKIYDVI